MDDTQRLDMILRLLERSDERRGSITQRATFILSAAAILVAGVAFFLDAPLRWLIESGRYPTAAVFACFIFLAFGLLFLAIIFSLTAIANIGRTSKQMLGTKNPPRLLFYPRLTLERFKRFDDFHEFLCSADIAEIQENAIGHFWVMLMEQFSRYQRLRKAARLLLASIAPFAIALIIYLCNMLMITNG